MNAKINNVYIWVLKMIILVIKEICKETWQFHKIFFSYKLGMFIWLKMGFLWVGRMEGFDETKQTVLVLTSFINKGGKQDVVLSIQDVIWELWKTLLRFVSDCIQIFSNSLLIIGMWNQGWFLYFDCLGEKSDSVGI